MTIAEYSIRRAHIPWSMAVPGYPLGRNLFHDSRNLAYPYRRTAPVLKTVLLKRYIAILDQGRIGSCTGNAEVGCLGTGPNYAALPKGHAKLGEPLAVKIYSAAESIDGDGPYPPNDNGSSGPSAAKAAMQMGLISGYTHCLSLQDVLDALQSQAVSIGINWYDSFDSPAPDGTLVISPGAAVRGGHEVELRGVDVDKLEVFGDNSWSESWGLKGSFRMGWSTLDRLLHEDGDGTVSVPLSQPAPAPTPAPTPVPAPSADAADRALWAGAGPWAHRRHWGSSGRIASGLEAWAHAKGLE